MFNCGAADMAGSLGHVTNSRSATPAHELARDTMLDRILKVGYISPDLKSHVVSKFLQGPVREHDRSQVKAKAVSPNRKPVAVLTSVCTWQCHMIAS